jgi:hypothetical protein
MLQWSTVSMLALLEGKLLAVLVQLLICRADPETN